MARKTAREAAMRLVYQRSVGGDGNVDDYCNQVEGVALDEEDRMYLCDVLKGVSDHADRIDEMIEQCSVNWKLSRMPRVDAAILRVAVYELLYRDDIPERVSANEAVGLAKQYSGEQSAKFINGVLGKLIRENAIHKECTQSLD
ncbi:MAG: transcription antitermination factor NusB [Bacillota bacterium]